MRLLHLAFTPLCLTLSLSVAAHASSLTELPPDPSTIYGGTEVGECGWPTTVSMEGCSGTLVSPEVAVFAAHCMFFAGGVGPSFVSFGESDTGPARQVATQSCTMFPGWVPDESTFGFDVAFCVLAEPVIDVPIVPILMGCETEILQPGQDITLVGFGVTEFGSFGVKYAVDTVVNGFEGPEINVGGGGTSSCNGDSGGPAFVQLDDGTWRAFGITSRGTSADCSQPSIYGLIYDHVPWIESTSGLDITPCHDADGTWNPSDGCTEFPLDPGVGTTNWAQGCAQVQLSGPSATCGDPLDVGGSTGGDTGEDTGLDESGDTGADTGLPGGTADDSDTDTTPPDTGSTGTIATGDDGSQDDEDTVITCSCRSNAPLPRATWLLLPILALTRRRR